MGIRRHCWISRRLELHKPGHMQGDRLFPEWCKLMARFGYEKVVAPASTSSARGSPAAAQSRADRASRRMHRSVVPEEVLLPFGNAAGLLIGQEALRHGGQSGKACDGESISEEAHGKSCGKSASSHHLPPQEGQITPT